MDWSKERRLLKAAGYEIPEAASSYRPGGYPRLGLSPLTATLSRRSVRLLGEQLERSEHDRGNTMFQAQGLSKMDVRLANELVSVFMGLSERYPSVWVDRINFSSSSQAGAGALAYAEVSTTNWPAVYSLSVAMGTVSLGELLEAVSEHEDLSPALLRKLRSETRHMGQHMVGRDLQSHGLISLHECFSHQRCYGTLQAYWQWRNDTARALGRPVRLVENQVSAASFVLLHEFGHVVEGALVTLGDEAYEKVLGALEDGVLRHGDGRLKFSDYRLRQEGLTRRDTHLVNYPSYTDKAFSDAATRRSVRRVVGGAVAGELGSYAKVSRDEMFAEAFALAHSAKSPELQARLAPFKQSLVDVGLGVSRRRARRL